MNDIPNRKCMLKETSYSNTGDISVVVTNKRGGNHSKGGHFTIIINDSQLAIETQQGSEGIVVTGNGDWELMTIKQIAQMLLKAFENVGE